MKYHPGGGYHKTAYWEKNNGEIGKTGMIQKATKCNSDEDIHVWNDIVQRRFEENYEILTVENGINWFKIGDDAFKINPFSKPISMFIVEYAEGQDKRALHLADDVDQYPIENCSSVEELIEEIKTDIEEAKSGY